VKVPLARRLLKPVTSFFNVSREVDGAERHRELLMALQNPTLVHGYLIFNIILNFTCFFCLNFDSFGWSPVRATQFLAILAGKLVCEFWAAIILARQGIL